MECCPRKLHSLATAWASHIVAVLTHFRLSPYPRPPSGRHCIAKSGQFGGETGATERGRLLRFLAGRPGELMGAIRGADTGRLRQYPRQTRAAGSGGPPAGCGFLSQALQRQAHRVIKFGGGEVGSELQLGNEAPEEYAALLYRQAVGGRPYRSKLRIRQSQHAAIVLRSNVNFLTDQGGGKRRPVNANPHARSATTNV